MRISNDTTFIVNKSMKDLRTRVDFRNKSINHSKTRMSQPSLYHKGKHSSHEFGSYQTAPRGTFCRNSLNFGGTWVNENINVPFFQQEETAFIVDTKKKI